MNNQGAAVLNSAVSPRWWGVDVASQKLDLGCDGVSEVETFDNSSDGIDRLVDRIAAEPVERIVVEATGGYETPLVVRLHAKRACRSW